MQALPEGRLDGITWTGQKLAGAVDRLVGDAREHVMQVALGLDSVLRSVWLYRSTVNGRGAFAAAVRAREQVILTAQQDCAQGAFRGAVVSLQTATPRRL